VTSSDMTPKAPISPSAADDVGVAHARWWDALRHEDVAVLDILLADNLTFHGPSGGVTTKAKYLEPALGSARIRLHHRRESLDPGARLDRHRDRPSRHLAPVGESVED